MTNLPIIFNPGDSFSLQTDTIIAGDLQWVEFVTHFTQFTTSTIPETKSQLKLILESDSDPFHCAMLTAGIGRCQIRQGRLLDGARSLGYAWNKLPAKTTDAHSFILLEMASLMALIGSYDQSIILLNRALESAQSDYLKRVGKYYELVNRSRKGEENILAELDKSRKWFAGIGQFIMEAYHLKNIGNIHRRTGQFNKTKRAYNRGIAIAEANGYNHIKADILHDMGMLEYHKGNFQIAIKILEQAAALTNNAYTRSFTTGNMGFLNFQRKDFTQALQLFEKSLSMAIEGGVFHLIPGACFYIGKAAQATGNSAGAVQYFEQAYISVMELVQNHFPMTAFRQKVVTAYVDHLQENQNDSPKPDNDLEFLLDKTLGEIRSVFQDSLIRMTLQKTATNREAIEKLQISARTFYHIRSRVKSGKQQTIQSAIQNFCMQREGESWKTMNREFEQTALQFLYSRYGGRKNMLSEKLGISYTHTVKLTEGMEKQMVVQ